MTEDFLLDPPAIDGSPAHAFASHRTRASAIARDYALAHPLDFMGAEADENNTIRLIAHLQAVSDDPDFGVPGQEPSRTLAPKVLKSLRKKGFGMVGTTVDPDRDTFLGFGYHIEGRPGDYDPALKGLVVIAYRYRHLLPDDVFDFILDGLVPPFIPGNDISSFEKYSLAIQILTPIPTTTPDFPRDAPETENHMLMIGSTIYLLNQLFFDRTREDRYHNNRENGPTNWLLGHLQTIAKHDFLEFNARPYQRYSLHALYNLHEFARDPAIRTAAQILLDYTMVKFAVSSNRQRRVDPFRRLKQYSNRADNPHNELLAAQGEGDDAVIGFSLTYFGPTDIDGKPLNRFPAGWGFEAVIAGLASYRPPPAAYILAMRRDIPAFQHRFYHGARPQVPAAGEQADGGVEIYYHSPSFLMTAGGMFLNSGYGHDEFTKFRQVGIAQSTTLLPTRADAKFADLIRFDPYPDEHRATNTAVHLGFACGANLRPSERRTFNDTTTNAVSLAAHDERLLLSWKGSGNDSLNTATVPTTALLGMVSIAELEEKVTLGDTSNRAPALASHNGRLFLAWKRADDDNLNLAFSDDNGQSFRGNRTLTDTSHHAPALSSHNGRLFLAWTGRGDGNLNVAKVALFANTAGAFGIEGLEEAAILGDTSEQGPALASHNGRLFLAWKGSGNDNLNLAFSDDNGRTFPGKKTFSDSDTSHLAPALSSHNGRLFLAWTGRGDGNVNVAKVVLFANTAGAFGIEGLEDKVTLGDTSEQAPALASYSGRLFLAWRGSGNENVNLACSRDGAFGPWFIIDLSPLGLYVAAYRTPPAQPDQLDTPLESLGLLYAMEVGDMKFEDFRRLTLDRNAALPAKFEYGGHYTFHTADNRHFAFWMHPSLAKYTVRVARTDEVRPAADFTSLSLVEGDYLSADDHNGFIRVLHPGCRDPLILDFSNPEEPERRDNMGSCPEPWLERAQALFDISQLLSNRGRDREAEAALRDRIAIYQRLADVNVVGASAAFRALLSLSKVGVDFSVPVDDLTDFLGNPEFTPYPAIAGALLQLLQGTALRQPVFMDVIVFNYENTPGIASPRKLADVDLAVLKEAVLEGYNTRYGEAINDFQSIVL
jgi:hypothetical protein